MKLWVLLVVLCASVFSERASHIRADLAKLERDIELIKSRNDIQNRPVEAFLADPPADDKDGVALDQAQFYSGGINLSLNGPVFQFYRASEPNGQSVVNHVLVIVHNRNPGMGGTSTLDMLNKRSAASYMNNNDPEKYAEWSARWWVDGVVNRGSFCSPSSDKKGLRCNIRGGNYEFRTVSPRGLLAMKPLAADKSADLLFWRHENFPAGINVDTLVSNVAEFLQFFQTESSAGLGDPIPKDVITRAVPLSDIIKRFDGARIAVVKGLEFHKKNWDKNAPTKDEGMSQPDFDKKVAADKLVLDSLINACADNFKTLEQWAIKIGDIFKNPENNPAAPFDSVKLQSVVSESLVTLKQKAQAPKLNDDSAKYLRQGADAAGKGIVSPIKSMLESYQKTLTADQIKADPSLDATPVINELNNGNMAKLFAEQLYNSVASNDAAINGLNTVTDFVAHTQKQMEDAGKEIGDYFKNLVGLNKKKKATQTAVDEAAKANGGTLKPGEDAAVTRMFDNAAAPTAKKTQESIDKLSVKSKFGVDPGISVSMPKGSGLETLQTMFKSVTAKYNLQIAKGKTSGEFDLKVKVDDPLDPNKAKAKIEATIKGKTDVGSGTLEAGVTARGEILGVYKSPTLQSVIVDTFVTYKSKDGRLSTGFFTTINIPMNDAANQNTYFKQGTEIDMRASLSWLPRKDESFTASAGVKASQAGSLEYSINARYERKFSNGNSMFLQGSISGGNTNGNSIGGPTFMISAGFRF